MRGPNALLNTAILFNYLHGTALQRISYTYIIPEYDYLCNGTTEVFF
jgi:hypothetical protein